MRATWVPPTRTPFTPLQLARAYLAVLKDANPGYIAVLMAHCALETGRDVRRGIIGPACWNWNLGNVKAGPTYEGFYTTIPLNERLKRNGGMRLIYFDPRGELVGGFGTAIVPGTEHDDPPGHPQTRMRAHLSLADGVDKKIAFLSAQRFSLARDCARRGDADGYVCAIYAQRYFTAEPGPYRRSVVSLAKTYLPVAGSVFDEEPTLPDVSRTPTLRPVEANLVVDVKPAPLIDLTDSVFESMKDRDVKWTQ